MFAYVWLTLNASLTVATLTSYRDLFYKHHLSLVSYGNNYSGITIKDD